MKKLGTAVIGTGFWGKNHARIYGELDSTELVAVCDVKREIAKAVADQFGVKAYTSSARMLKNEKIGRSHIIYIVSGPHKVDRGQKNHPYRTQSEYRASTYRENRCHCSNQCCYR